jgi:hypothetical protein
MADSFSTLVGRVLLRCPSAGRFLAEDWVREAWLDICAPDHRWSWMYGFDQFLVPAVYQTGTAAVTQNSTTVTGTSTVWDTSMAGRQFRIGTANVIYTIQSVESATSLTLDKPWGNATATAQSYEIYQCYFTAPDDFQSFISVWDPNFNWQLVLDYSQNVLNAADAQRANSGNAYLVAWRDYSSSAIGKVEQPVQVDGSGPDPGSAGTYSGPNNALFTVEITTGGASGTAVFRWKKDGGSYTSGVTTDVAGAAQDLQDGVQVYFPTGATYVLGDIWVIRATAGANAGRPRFEIWPHQKAQYVYPFLYWKRPMDISQTNVTIPYSIDSNLILDMALAKAASWPGPATDRPNPFYRLELADRHERKAQQLLLQAQVKDQEIFMSDTIYQEATAMPFAPVPALGDVNWLQKHDI